MTTCNIRHATLDDAPAILAVYKAAARQGGGLLRREDEVTAAYVEHNLSHSLATGLSLIAEHDGTCLGELHGWARPLRQQAHVLSHLTIAITPQAQGQGVGRRLFEALIAHVEHDMPHIQVIELLCREDNARAIALYRAMGFVLEGRLTNRVALEDGTFKDDLIMGLQLASRRPAAGA